MDADDLLLGLDPDQRLAVTSPSPLVAVIAGAGSGKTNVLTRRLAYRVLTEAADPSHVVALTFTRQAASEMRRRLRRLGLRDRFASGTFHATALSMLRQHWLDRGRPAPTVTGERLRLVATALGERRREAAREVTAEIDWARARLVSPDRYATAAAAAGRRTGLSAATVAEAFAAYEQLKRSRGVVDLDDLLTEALRLMREDANFAAAARWRFRHLFVDEAQDLNPLQAALLDEVRRDRDDLTLVGDPSQAIYGFNGADPGLLERPERRFPGIEVVRLGTNYRCTPEIVAAGVSVLAQVGEPPALRSARPEGAAVRIVSFPDEQAEARGAAQLARALIPPHGRWSGVAVLARTNAQLGPIAAALEAVGIPARLSGAARTSSPLQRALREAGEQTSRHLLASWAVDATQFADDATAEPAEAEANTRVAAAVEEYLSFGGGDGPGFLSWVRATDPFQDAATRDAVEVLTFHAAKGREWTSVVVTGACTGLVPHASATTAAERAEETRLLYVALTRAADHLVVTWPSERNGRRAAISPWLTGISTAPEPPVAPPPGLPRPAPAVSPVLDALRQWRERAARAAGTSPTAVLSDRTLEAIAADPPRTEADLAAIPGVGPLLAQRLGHRLLDVIADAG